MLAKKFGTEVSQVKAINVVKPVNLSFEDFYIIINHHFNKLIEDLGEIPHDKFINFELILSVSEMEVKDGKNDKDGS